MYDLIFSLRQLRVTHLGRRNPREVLSFLFTWFSTALGQQSYGSCGRRMLEGLIRILIADHVAEQVRLSRVGRLKVARL